MRWRASCSPRIATPTSALSFPCCIVARNYLNPAKSVILICFLQTLAEIWGSPCSRPLPWRRGQYEYLRKTSAAAKANDEAFVALILRTIVICFVFPRTRVECSASPEVSIATKVPGFLNTVQILSTPRIPW